MSRQEPENKSDELVLSSFSANEPKNNVYLQTVQASINQNGKSIFVRALLDGGSQKTFIRQDISRQLKLPIVGQETLRLHTFGNKIPAEVTRNRVRLTLCNTKIPEKAIQIEALESPDICTALVQVPAAEIREIMQTKGLCLADAPNNNLNSDITMLIGADFYWKVVTGKTDKIINSLIAVESIFGWCVHGPAFSPLNNAINTVSVMKIIVDPELTETSRLSSQMKAFWELDSLGIVDNSEINQSENEQIMQRFKSTINFKNNAYEVALPWKEDIEPTANNYPVAERRLNTLIKKFRANPNFFYQYKEVIEDYSNRGYIESVDNETKVDETSRTFYLPHQAVIKEERETTKLRVVFDASAHEKGAPSLNDCLYSGPNLLPDVLTMLLKFRMNRIAFTADIEKAFLQISLREEDRNAVRFLWPNDPIDSEVVRYQTFRMTRVLFGLTASPFLLQATIKYHLEQFKDTHPEIYKLVNDNLYMDDLVGGADTSQEASQLASETNKIFECAGMTLRKWRSNSPELRNEWKEQENKQMSFSNPCLNNLKVLGIVWDSENDVISFDLSALISMLMFKTNTKRGVLKLAARLFDPVGLLTPFTITVKCMFQELWERGLEWDAPLPADISSAFNEWCDQLSHLNNVRIPRYFFQEVPDGSAGQIEIHCFCDASQKAYGTCVYFRFSTNRGAKTCLVASKTRVAPLKRVTLPRLELMAALIGSRLVNHVKNSLNVKEYPCTFWTDSAIAYYWIHGIAKKWKPFVSNRVTEIKELNNPQDWRHCPGRDNPADLITRGIKAAALQESQLWWNGPPWLTKSRENWPKEEPKSVGKHLVIDEIRSEAVSATIQIESKTQNPLFERTKYSSFNKLLRVTAWIIRFTTNIRNPQNKSDEVLSAGELLKAKEYWIKQIQFENFSDEIETLQNKADISKESKLRVLNPYLDSKGILRVHSRLQNPNMTYDEIQPIILPKRNKIVELLIEHYHRKLMHAGVSHTLSAIRETYWIIQGRQATKTVIKRCFVCRKFGSKPLQAPTAPLPAERTIEAPPFSVTGVDFAGPLFVKTNQGREKAYIALFTCGVTRAIHLELVSKLNTPSFLLAFRRFISRRGICHTIYSDNAKTFKRAEKELKHLWDAVKEKEIRDFLGQQGIKWKNIVECAAWWGGMWERLVRSVKISLKKTIGNALLSFEEMETTLIEAEAMINSRPMTYMYNEVNEPIPLTPNCFLIGDKTSTLPQKNPIKENTSADRRELTKRMVYRNILMTKFWNTWRKDYLLQLRSAHYRNTQDQTSIKANDLVLIKDDNLPRQMWKLGVVEEVFIGRDGIVRSCAIRVPKGQKIKRPVKLPCSFVTVPAR